MRQLVIQAPHHPRAVDRKKKRRELGQRSALGVLHGRSRGEKRGRVPTSDSFGHDPASTTKSREEKGNGTFCHGWKDGGFLMFGPLG